MGLGQENISSTRTELPGRNEMRAPRMTQMSVSKIKAWIVMVGLIEGRVPCGPGGGMV